MFGNQLGLRCFEFYASFRFKNKNANKFRDWGKDGEDYTMGFSSMIGLPGAVLLAELAMSLKLWIDPDRDVDTFVFTLSYAPPTDCSKDLNESEFFICDSLFVKPLKSDDVFSAVAFTTDSVLW